MDFFWIDEKLKLRVTWEQFLSDLTKAGDNNVFIKNTNPRNTKIVKSETNKKFVAEISIPATTKLKRGAILN